MVKDVVDPSPQGCIIAVSPNGWAVGLNETEALRNLHLAAGNQSQIEVYASETLRRGAVWVDEQHLICWQGEHEPPTLIARIINGKRTAVDQPQPTSEPPPPTTPLGYVAKMIQRRKPKQ